MSPLLCSVSGLWEEGDAEFQSAKQTKKKKVPNKPVSDLECHFAEHAVWVIGALKSGTLNLLPWRVWTKAHTLILKAERSDSDFRSCV